MKFLRTELPIYLGIMGGIICFGSLFLSIGIVQDLSRWFLEWRVILASFALALGLGNLLRIHYRRIEQKRQGWWYSGVLLAAMVGYAILGIGWGRTHVAYSWVFDWAYSPLSATVFSLNAFFLTTACYRAFRARNLQAAVLLISGVIVMLGKVGIGYAIWPGFSQIADWLMNQPNSAAMRGVNMGAAMGILGVSLRIILGLERGHLGVE